MGRFFSPAMLAAGPPARGAARRTLLATSPSATPAAADQEKRKQIAWEIDRKLTQDAVRPMIYYMRGATCWRPEVKNMTMMVNSIYNGWRMEDVWLQR